MKGAINMNNIGSRRELFLDNHLIDTLDGASLKLQVPRPGGTALIYGEGKNAHLEGHMANYTTVLEDAGTYRMYYRTNTYERTDRGFESLTSYVESSDGINWSRPGLGLVEVDGSSENNIILKSGWQFCPFVDKRPGVPSSERYKGNARHQDGLKGYVSPDGIHWKEVSEEVVVPNSLKNHFDAQNSMFWSEFEEQYVLYARHMEAPADVARRATAKATSLDFVKWSEPTKMTYSDTGSEIPSEHLYTNQTTPYWRAPHIYISMPGRIFFDRRKLSPDEQEYGDRELDPGIGKPQDCSDGVLLTSRAGTTEYDFTFLESFVRPGIGQNNWTSRNNYPALGVVPAGATEMAFYVQRDSGQKNAYLERMLLRLDGFSSLHGPYVGGEATTKVISFDGDELRVNYATSAAGRIKMEIQDEKGNPVKGYELDRFDELIGDEIDRRVSWGGVSSVSSLSGKNVRLRFVLSDADLFSYKFQPST